MRLWTLHPDYLDARGLAALWREGLLAQKVLLGETRGYTRHPQLLRFRHQPDPPGAIAAYLEGVWQAASLRGYAFDRSRIGRSVSRRMMATSGQLAYEWQHLMDKLRVRDTTRSAQFAAVRSPLPHPLFEIVPGPVEPWEVAAYVGAVAERAPKAPAASSGASVIRRRS